MEKQAFGTTHDGQHVDLFKLTNAAGMEAHICEYGAILTALSIPGQEGGTVDLTLGHDELEAWEASGFYFGATAGRYGNRIKGGRFSLDGSEYQLAKNNDPAGLPCHLHGGVKGFDQVVWSGELVEKAGATGVKLSYFSKDGEEGYPGNLSTTVTYWLTDKNELVFEVEATTDKATPVNIIHHSYWNLSGDAETAINDHELQIHADHFIPTTAGLIPTGEKAEVGDTPMDFRKSTTIGARIEADFEPLKLAGGYDHCWVIRGEGLRVAAKVTDPKTGRSMEVFTDQVGVQFYSGNFLDGKTEGKKGVTYPRRSGLCLESECFPDSPNQPTFPSCILNPGETYRHTLIHRFHW